MEKPIIYEFRVEGHLTDWWSDWFDGLAIRNEPNGETILVGVIRDQADLFGVLSKLHALNLTLISVRREVLISSTAQGWVSPAIRLLAETKMRFDRNRMFEFPPFALRIQDSLLDNDDPHLDHTDMVLWIRINLYSR